MKNRNRNRKNVENLGQYGKTKISKNQNNTKVRVNTPRGKCVEVEIFINLKRTQKQTNKQTCLQGKMAR